MEYPSITRAIRAVKVATYGYKRAAERRLVKARTASLKRELRRAVECRQEGIK